MKKRLFNYVVGLIIAVVFLLGSSGPAKAALIDLGNGVVHDSLSNQYWFKDLSLFTNKTYYQQLSEITNLNAPSSGFTSLEYGSWHIANIFELSSLTANDLISYNQLFVDPLRPFPGNEQYWVRYENISEPGYHDAMEIDTIFHSGDSTVMHTGWELDTIASANLSVWVTAVGSPVPVPNTILLVGPLLITLCITRIRGKIINKNAEQIHLQGHATI